jgi:UDPglucose 6-dehydrogenase
MKLTIFGSGYVGLVTGACLAEVGNKVMCVDVDPAKIDLLNNGGVPIYEPGLAEMVSRNREAGRLEFTTDAKTGVDFGEIQFIAVGTPPDEDGSADLQYVLAVAESIAEHMTDHKIVVDKSTVPVGTGDKVAARIRETQARRGVDIPFDVVSNPEFLKEGAAIGDFMKPDRIVVGTESPPAIAAMRALYAPFNRNHDRVLFMDIRSAELTKYAANAMLATKISFMNELANLAEILGADIESVRIGIGSDPRIGFQFIYPGCGYGGSCFPKDVQALERAAAAVGYAADLLTAVESVNNRQKTLLFHKIHDFLDGDLAGRRRRGACSTRRGDNPRMTSFGLCRQRHGHGSGWLSGRRTKKNASVNGFRGWVRAPRCRPDAVRWSAGRPNTGVDGCDQAIRLAENAL